jgi:CubicO group peptidase (beta-lactamase class C family)
MRSLLRRGRRADEPGMAFAWVKDGKTRFRDAWGQASLELPSPLTPTSVFNGGSLAKQFVAACLHDLEMQGKLSLDDRLRAHIPELPAVYEPVRLRHLLWHTSGVLCYTTLLWWSGLWEQSGLPREQALALLKRQDRLNFKPGSRYLYGNSNYALLTEVLVRVGGAQLNAQAQALLFKPLGMRQTHFREFASNAIPGLVQGHWRPSFEWRVDRHLGAAPGAGRLMCSLLDLELWAKAWQEPPRRLRALFKRMQVRGQLDDGRPIRYGSGLMWQDYRGLAMIRHDGYTSSCRSELCHVPALGSSFICLSNRTDLSPTWAVRRALDRSWPRALKPVQVWPDKGPDRPAGRPEGRSAWRRRAGLYRQDGAERAFELTAHAEGLKYLSYKTEFVLKPDRPGGYQGQESGAICRIDFEPDGSLRLLQKGKASRYRRLRERKATVRDDALCGTWVCPATGASTRYSRERGRLLFHGPNWTGPIRAMRDGSYYLDQIRLELKGRRLLHLSDDAWILRLDWVKAKEGRHVG